jgi:hypothetical protein
MRRAVPALLVGAALWASPAAAQVVPPDPAAPPHSVAVGKPWDGRL